MSLPSRLAIVLLSAAWCVSARADDASPPRPSGASPAATAGVDQRTNPSVATAPRRKSVLGRLFSGGSGIEKQNASSTTAGRETFEDPA